MSIHRHKLFIKHRLVEVKADRSLISGPPEREDVGGTDEDSFYHPRSRFDDYNSRSLYARPRRFEERSGETD